MSVVAVKCEEVKIMDNSHGQPIEREQRMKKKLNLHKWTVIVSVS